MQSSLEQKDQFISLALMKGWSLEATLPKPEEIELLAGLLDPGREMFLSTLPHVSLDQQIETARRVRERGFEPVLHLAARYFASRTEAVGYLARAAREADARRMLVIGGDLDAPRGEFTSAADLIRSGILSDYGIEGIDIAAYPDGHPNISEDVLADALAEKIVLARDAGCDVRVVTQFCFDARPVRNWLADFRKVWPDVPVKIGLAGPTSLNAVLRYAMRCGVKAPKSGLGRKLSMAARLAGSYTPDSILDALNQGLAADGLAAHVSAHFFSFGGIERTARWAAGRH